MGITIRDGRAGRLTIERYRRRGETRVACQCKQRMGRTTHGSPSISLDICRLAPGTPRDGFVTSLGIRGGDDGWMDSFFYRGRTLAVRHTSTNGQGGIKAIGRSGCSGAGSSGYARSVMNVGTTMKASHPASMVFGC